MGDPSVRGQYAASLTILAGEHPKLDAVPRDDGAARTPWLNKWEFERGGKRMRVRVLVLVPIGTKMLVEDALGAEVIEENGTAMMATTIDARAWIESVAEETSWPEGTRFHLVAEEVGHG